MNDGFRPAWWCLNPHLQTLWPRLAGYRPRPRLFRERVELADGDFIDLDWVNYESRDRPMVLIIHGLEGSTQSPYALGILKALEHHGWRGVVMNLRGCSGEDNRLPRAYHSGDTVDLHQVMQHLKNRHANTPLAVVGYSIGGNMLLKWLGQQEDMELVDAAIAVSVPFDLGQCADVLHHSLFRVYENYFMRRLLARIKRKLHTMTMPVTAEELDKLNSIREFDNAVTAPLHGFASDDDYYTRSSCRQFLPHIKHQCLIVHAQDDPFMTPAVIPGKMELGKNTRLELYRNGGHVGFVSGNVPGKAGYWLEHRIIEYLQPLLHCHT